MEILSKDIKCTKTLALIKSLLRAGYVSDMGELTSPYIGAPQGSVLSPLLCNIYLHYLDLFMEDIIEKYQKLDRKPNNKYQKIASSVKYMRSKGYHQVTSSRYMEYRTKLKLLIRTSSISETSVKIVYVRYADDFLIGVKGSYTLANQILCEVDQYLKSMSLTLNRDKTKLTDFQKTHISFLGYNFKSQERNEKAYENIVEKVSGRLIKRRKKVRLSLRFDYSQLLDKLKTNKFIRVRTAPQKHSEVKLRGTFRGNLINLNHQDILRYYNAVMRRIYNNYKVCNNTPQLSHIL